MWLSASPFTRPERRSRAHDSFVIGWWVRGLGLGTLAHTNLADFQQAGWLAPELIGWVGGSLLLITPLRPSQPFQRDLRLVFAWICGLLCLAKLYTLLTLRDVLTQSLLLCCYYALAALGLWAPRWSHSALRASAICAGLTYLLAALHKVNSDFIYSEYSCALHGVDLSVGLFHSGVFPVQLVDLLDGFMIWARRHTELSACSVLAWEALLGALCIAGSRWILLFGGLFHTPLTLSIAPAFGSVMAVGWGASSLSKLGRRNRARAPRPPRGRWLIIIPITYGLHGGLSPYLGIEYQHSAAMLSNLRIDPPCANSLIFPTLASDPYIYIDEISFGERERPKRSEIVRETLWNLSALYTMQHNWCIPEQRPLRVQLRYHGVEVILDDLCDEDALDDLSRGQPFARGWQRFQKNLSRQCHTQCVH